MSNPVQIILNDKDFIRPPEAGRMGARKDFFPDQDAEFKKHKEKLIAQVGKIAEEITASSYGPATYVRVKLKEDALAKSYRPTNALFKPETFPCVGVGGLGEVYYLLYSKNLSLLTESMNAADPQTTWRISNNTGEKYASRR